MKLHNSDWITRAKSTFEQGRQLGEQLKLEGMERAATARQDHLRLARGIARTLGRQKRLVCADDVMKIMLEKHGIKSLGPATGSLFKTKDWKWNGEWVNSARPSNHARSIRLWTFTGDLDE